MIINKQKGFTLIETLVYLFIASMLLMVISGLIMNILNCRKRIQASNEIQNNARFIVNFLNNKIHNTDLIADVSPSLDQLHFYQLPGARFSFGVEDGNLIYREVFDVGSGFPDQSTAIPMILNTDKVTVSDFILLPVEDSEGNINRGVVIEFTLTIGRSDDNFGYFQENFHTFMSLR